MAGHRVDYADVDELVKLIQSAEGIRSVSVEAAEIQPPGVWVQHVGYTFNKYAGYTINSRLILVVSDQNPRRAAKALTDLLNQVLTVVTPTGPVLARTVVLPESSAPLPGLTFPLDVHATPAPQE